MRRLKTATIPRVTRSVHSCSAATTLTTSFLTPKTGLSTCNTKCKDWLFSAGYIGNHGQHEILPIPFNEPLLATPQHPVNGQIYSYGGTNYDAQGNYVNLSTEPISTGEYSGNAPIRVPYIGYDMNSVLYEAEGVSNYNALQLQVRKRYANGLQLTATYTRSHSLDEQSGLGLFLTGNNPNTPRTSYASSDFDRPNVFLINYSYTIPKLTSNKALGAAINGWTIGGQTVAQSGEPYSFYDYSGSVGSLYFGTDVEISNPDPAPEARRDGGTGDAARHHRRESGQAGGKHRRFLSAICATGNVRSSALRTGSRLRQL